ncbi:MAG: hypothetical protein GY835_04795 [bacterium]|nr:hypothetical protein [bacterium]
MIRDCTADGQRAVLEVAIELIRLNKRLTDIAEAVPMPPDVDDMHENITPNTVAVNLHGIVRCVQSDLLLDAISTLIGAANKTDADLRTEHLTRERRRR